MVLSLGHNNLIPLFDICFSKTECSKIHRCSCSACEYYFFPEFSIDKILHCIPCLLVSLSSLISQFMHGSMDIRIRFTGYSVPLIDHTLGTLAGRSIIEIHQILSIYFSGKNGKHISDIIDQHNKLFRTCKFNKNNVFFYRLLS